MPVGVCEFDSHLPHQKQLWSISRAVFLLFLATFWRVESGVRFCFSFLFLITNSNKTMKYMAGNQIIAGPILTIEHITIYTISLR